MISLLKKVVRDERGVSALEYALIAGMLAGVIVTAVTAFGGQLSGAFTRIGTKLSDATQ